MVVSLTIFYAVVAAIANFGPLVLLAMYGLQGLGYRVDLTRAFEGWLYRTHNVWVDYLRLAAPTWGESGGGNP